MTLIENKFKINEYITLRLESNQTVIYVAGKPFSQCKNLLFSVPLQYRYLVEYIDDTFDEIAEHLGWYDKVQRDEKGEELFFRISPKEEFWGYCSSFQVWVEQNYNMKFIHYTIGFPLLKRLTEVGDLLAKEKFQQEIINRFEDFDISRTSFLIGKGYFNYLSEDMQEDLMKQLIRNEYTYVYDMFIDGGYLDSFPERIANFMYYTYLEVKHKKGLKRMGIYSQGELLTQILSNNFLNKVFGKYQYPVPEKGQKTGIGYSFLEILRDLFGFLMYWSQKNSEYQLSIRRQIIALFETPSIESLFSLLQYKYYNFLSLHEFKDLLKKPNSLLALNLINYLSHKPMMSYYDSSLNITHFICKYLDDECRSIFAEQINILSEDIKNTVISSLSMHLKNKYYSNQLIKMLGLIRNLSNDYDGKKTSVKRHGRCH